MKLSIATHMTNPEERMDPWEEALECYSHFSKTLFSWKRLEEEFEWKNRTSISRRL